MRCLARAPARLRGALLGVETLPIGAELRYVCAIGMRDDAELDERVGLRACHALHLVEMNDVESKLRMALQPAADLAPEIAEARRVDPRAEFRRKQRAVVVAQQRAEPGQPPRETAALDAERQKKQQLAI